MTPPASSSNRPPPGADALLEKCLPEGVQGLSIIGDLHEEFE